MYLSSNGRDLEYHTFLFKKSFREKIRQLDVDPAVGTALFAKILADKNTDCAATEDRIT